MRCHLCRLIFAVVALGACQPEMHDYEVQLPLVEERTETWSAADETERVVFQDRVFWVEPHLFDDASYTDGVLRTDIEHVFSTLSEGDVIVTSWNAGMWRKVVRRASNGSAIEIQTRAATIGDILEEGRLLAQAQKPDGGFDTDYIPLGLSTCVDGKCAGELEFRSTNGDALNWVEPFGGIELRATDFDFEFRPVFRYEEGVDRRRGAYSRMRVTGDLELGARFDVQADRPSSSRVSYPLLGAGSSGVVISWASERDPTTDEPGDPRVSEFYLLDQIDKVPLLTAQIAGDEFVVQGPENVVVFEFEPFDEQDPLFPAGGIALDDFVTGFNEAFAGSEFRARYVVGSGGYSVNAFVYSQREENSVSFALLGRQVDAYPQMDIAQAINVPAPGRVITTARVDARVDAGWACFERGGCEFDGAGVFPASTARMTSEIIDGEPWIDMGIGLRPTVVARRGASPFSTISAGILQIRNEIQTDPPFCSTLQSIKLQYEVRRLEQRLYRSDDILYENEGHSPELMQCTGDGRAPLDCSVCETSGSQACIEDVCGPDSGCFLGRCTVAAPFDVGLTWTASEPPVDLDLWLELADGRVVHPGNIEAGPATHANQSDGGVSSQAQSALAGVCKGDLDRICESLNPSGSTCPGQCTFVADSPSFCHPEPITCSKWWDEFGTCPAECRSACVPGVDDDCILPCSGDDCYACRGEATIDYTGCASKSAEAACSATDNCSWQSGGTAQCTGGRVRCDSMGESECQAESQCDWAPNEREIEFPPFVERVALSRLIDQAIEVWVVNPAGTERDQPIPFELTMRLRADEQKVIQGFVGPEAGAKSLRYRYRVDEL